jgi:hypothetical protein
MEEQSFIDRYSRQMLLHEVQRSGQLDISVRPHKSKI